MKKSVSILIVLLTLFLAACQAMPQVAVAEPTVATAPTAAPTVEVLPAPTEEPTPAPTEVPTEAPLAPMVEIKYAHFFTLEYKEGYKLLTIKAPEADVSAQYALVPRDSQPKIAESDAVIVQTPIEKIITLSSTYYPMLEQIGELERVVAIDDSTYTYNEKIRAGVEEGKIAVVGGDGFSAALDLEKVIGLAPDILMAPYFNAQILQESKLEEAGQTLVLNGDYLENTPLGRAEWGVFLAAFFDKEAEAAQIFDQTAARYEKAKTLAAGMDNKVSVLVNTAFEGSWYMPGTDSYVAAFLKDAGAQYLFDEDVEGTGATPLAFEVVYEKAKDADYWLNVGFAADLKSLVAEDSRYEEFKAVKEGTVYNNNARMNPNGGTDYYESGVANPDLILMDLIKIFYPDLLPEHELYYYSKVN